MFGHGESEPEGPPPDPNDGHERTDIAAKPIIIFLIGLVLFGSAVQGSMSLLMRAYIAQDTKNPDPPKGILQDTGVITRSPPLQQNTTKDMINMYKEEDEILTSYYVDPKTKATRIPLDKALAVIGKKGLPFRAGSKEAFPGDNIPRAGRAYQSTN